MDETARLFLKSLAVMGLFEPPLPGQRVDLAGKSQDRLALGNIDGEQVVDYIVAINFADINLAREIRKHFGRAFERLPHLRVKFLFE